MVRIKGMNYLNQRPKVRNLIQRARRRPRGWKEYREWRSSAREALGSAMSWQYRPIGIVHPQAILEGWAAVLEGVEED